MNELNQITLVLFTETAPKLQEETPKIVDLPVQCKLPSLEGCIYNGVVTDIPPVVLQNIMHACPTLESEIDKYEGVYSTICMIMQDTVLFMDLLSNSDNYTEHPLSTLGKAYVIRDKLDRVLLPRKLRYLSQSDDWYMKRISFHAENAEYMRR